MHTNMTIIINSKSYNVTAGATLAEALQSVLGTIEGMAAAVNGAVVPRGTWDTHILNEGDDTIPIKATYGG